MKHTVNITVRNQGDAYLARGGGECASCTSSAVEAVQRVAMKCAGFTANYNSPNYVRFEQTGITITLVVTGAPKGNLWVAEWEAK